MIIDNINFYMKNFGLERGSILRDSVVLSLKLTKYNPSNSLETKEVYSLATKFIDEIADNDDVERIIVNKEILLLAINETIIGFIGYVKNSRDPGILNISSLFIDTAYRGNNYGLILLTLFINLIKEIKTITKIQIGVNSKNIKAKNLYLSLGFIVIKTGVEDGQPFTLLEKHI